MRAFRSERKPFGSGSVWPTRTKPLTRRTLRVRRAEKLGADVVWVTEKACDPVTQDPGAVVNRVAALRFFFVKTLKRRQFREFLPYPQERRRLPTVLSQEEVSSLIQRGRDIVSTHAVDDPLRHRHATRRTRASR